MIIMSSLMSIFVLVIKAIKTRLESRGKGKFSERKMVSKEILINCTRNWNLRASWRSSVEDWKQALKETRGWTFSGTQRLEKFQDLSKEPRLWGAEPR